MLSHLKHFNTNMAGMNEDDIGFDHDSGPEEVRSEVEKAPKTET